jgi:hypothetical protein
MRKKSSNFICTLDLRTPFRCLEKGNDFSVAFLSRNLKRGLLVFVVSRGDVRTQLQKDFDALKFVVPDSHDQRSPSARSATVYPRAARRDKRSTRLNMTAGRGNVKGSPTNAILVLHVQRVAILPPKAKNLIGVAVPGSSPELVSLDLGRHLLF